MNFDFSKITDYFYKKLTRITYHFNMLVKYYLFISLLFIQLHSIKPKELIENLKNHLIKIMTAETEKKNNILKMIENSYPLKKSEIQAQNQVILNNTNLSIQSKIQTLEKLRALRKNCFQIDLLDFRLKIYQQIINEIINCELETFNTQFAFLHQKLIEIYLLDIYFETEQKKIVKDLQHIWYNKYTKVIADDAPHHADRVKEYENEILQIKSKINNVHFKMLNRLLHVALSANIRTENGTFLDTLSEHETSRYLKHLNQYIDTLNEMNELNRYPLPYHPRNKRINIVIDEIIMHFFEEVAEDYIYSEYQKFFNNKNKYIYIYLATTFYKSDYPNIHTHILQNETASLKKQLAFNQIQINQLSEQQLPNQQKISQHQRIQPSSTLHFKNTNKNQILLLLSGVTIFAFALYLYSTVDQQTKI